MSMNNTTDSDTYFPDCIPGEPNIVESEEFDLLDFTAPDPTRSYPPWELALKFSFYALAILMDLVGNTIVILIIVVNTKMRTTTNILIANLAVSDILVACFCMWVHAGNSVTENWPFDRVFCVLSTFCQIVSVTASTLTLTVIAVERFYVVWFPFRRKWSPVVTWSIIAVIWMASIGTAAPQLAVRRMYVVHFQDQTQHWCVEAWQEYYTDYNCNTYAPARKKYHIVTVVVMYFVPIAVMVLTYSLIGYKLLHKKPIGNAPANGKMSHQERTKRKITKMLIVVLVVFIVFWTPQQAVVLHMAIEQANEPDSVMTTVRYIALYLAYFSSAVNPYLYAGLNENFRRGFVEAFKCLLVQRPNRIDPDDVGNRSQHTVRTAKSLHTNRVDGRDGSRPVQTVTQDQLLTVPSRDHFTTGKQIQVPPANNGTTSLQDAPNGAPDQTPGKQGKANPNGLSMANVYLVESSL